MPLIIAHRGASAYAPENTMAAFELACEQGADMLELDVQRSADGELIVFHDHTTAHWNGQNRLVKTYTVAELRQLDIGGERIATLAEVCTLARERTIALNVELKQPDIVTQSVELLRAHGIVEQTLVSSFYETALIALHHSAPEIKLGYLMGIKTYRPAVRARELWPLPALQRVQAAAWHPAYQLPMLRRVLARVRRAGYAVNVWTVDEPNLIRRLVAWGATGIITNQPDVARQCLEICDV